MDLDLSEYFYQGRVFSSKEEFQDAVVMAAVEHRFEVMTKASESHEANMHSNSSWAFYPALIGLHEWRGSFAILLKY